MKDRVRFCRAGAIAAPAGLDAAMPLAGSDGATAVPSGCCGAGCCCCGVAGCDLLLFCEAVVV
jgi:hypothetical protein